MIDVPGLMISEHWEICSSAVFLSNGDIPDMGKISLSSEEEVFVSHVVNNLSGHGLDRDVLLFAAYSLTNGFSSDIALSKYNKEVSELARRLYEMRSHHEIKDAIWGLYSASVFSRNPGC